MFYTHKMDTIVYDYKVNDTVLGRVEFIKDLGVTFDSKFNFSLHYINIVSSTHKMLGFIIRVSLDFYFY
ncbi:hypothetical protein BDFB_014694 [Asbolus verrucosus]|uniref:Uncharacterized protein n=1 Tax=Asbolus verrucosus TaxID=1661398 RepID=A0A482VPS5_ASBVE|nr:hypothetical protein BDFB_014694 [Asbolus verrucosus]